MNMIGSGSTAEPDFALALAKITRMSKDELNELLNKEEKAEEYIKSLDQVSKIHLKLKKKFLNTFFRI